MTNLELALIERIEELEKELFEARREIGKLKDQIGDLNKFYKEGPTKKTKKNDKEVKEVKDKSKKRKKENNSLELEFKQFEEEVIEALYQDELDHIEYMSCEEYKEYMDTEIAEHSQSWIVQYNYDKKYNSYDNPELSHELDLLLEETNDDDEIPF